MKKNLLRDSLAQTFALCLCAMLLIGSTPLAAQAKQNPREIQQSYADTVRFLEQSTFGPWPELISYVQEIGFEAFLEEQFNTSITEYPELPNELPTRPPTCTGACQRDKYTMYPLQVHFFNRAVHGPDQLRQRVAFALHQIFVVSGRDITQPSWMAPYLRVLDRNSFGNFRQLLEETTLNTAMGYYLDMRRSTRTSPNENFAREILQLFSIGLVELNQNGTPVLDAEGRQVPTYDQTTVNEFAKAFTGWYEPAARTPGIPNYIDPMRVWLPEATYHHPGQKQLLNYPGAPYSVLPAGQSTRQDLDQALDNIFYHPNVGPYIGKQLIQRLVTSNPSPDYVWRVAGVFNDNGTGVRGDLKAVVKAILLDPEARGDFKDGAIYGKLREPILLVTNLLRPFYGNSDGVLAGSQVGGGVTNYLGALDQDPLRPPTVFNYFPFDYELPGTETPVLAPEFGILSTATALGRVNFINTLIFPGIPPANGVGGAGDPDRPIGTQLDLSRLEAVANDPVQLVAELDALLMHGTTSENMRNIIADAVSVIPESDRTMRAKQALYLFATTGQYQVQR